MSDGVVEHGGRLWARDNRWDLIADRVGSGPRDRTAVVVTHFEQPASLRRMYVALGGLDPTRFELVITDDGSRSTPPPPPAGFPIPTTVVRQEHHGCRPGAARNLGAASTTADNLVFLDADTVPGPGTVARLAAWPDLAPDALVVGRRGHVDLSGWSPPDVAAWLAGRREPPARRPDPRWLDDGYRETRDLLDADDRSYRFVISAVMACHRSLWDDVGGFDPSRDEYGGDDWEFAYRAFNNGALLVHDPGAVAWHDEPDWGQRDGGSKNDETLWLATVIPEPATRGRGIIHAWPDVLIELRASSSGAGALVATIADILSDVPDARLHLTGPVPRWAMLHIADDPRVSIEAPSVLQRQRARIAIVIRRPVRWPPGSGRRLLAELRPGQAGCVAIGDGEGPLVVATSTRLAARRRRCASAPIDTLASTVRWSSADAGIAARSEPVDLAAELRRARA
jgi:hypothetical protein